MRRETHAICEWSGQRVLIDEAVAVTQRQLVFTLCFSSIFVAPTPKWKDLAAYRTRNESWIIRIDRLMDTVELLRNCA